MIFACASSVLHRLRETVTKIGCIPVERAPSGESCVFLVASVSFLSFISACFTPFRPVIILNDEMTHFSISFYYIPSSRPHSRHDVCQPQIRSFPAVSAFVLARSVCRARSFLPYLSTLSKSPFMFNSLIQFPCYFIFLISILSAMFAIDPLTPCFVSHASALHCTVSFKV